MFLARLIVLAPAVILKPWLVQSGDIRLCERNPAGQLRQCGRTLGFGVIGNHEAFGYLVGNAFEPFRVCSDADQASNDINWEGLAAVTAMC